MFFQVRYAAEFSRHMPSPARAAPYRLWSPQGWRTPKAAILLPGDIAIPWPQLWSQHTAALRTRGSRAGRFYNIIHQAWSQNQLSLCRHKTTQISLPAWAPGLCFLQFSPCIKAKKINPKEQGLFCGPGANPHHPAGDTPVDEVLQLPKTGWPLCL